MPRFQPFLDFIIIFLNAKAVPKHFPFILAHWKKKKIEAADFLYLLMEVGPIHCTRETGA